MADDEVKGQVFNAVSDELKTKGEWLPLSARVAVTERAVGVIWRAAGSIPVLAEVAAERARQDAKWGEQNHPDGTGPDGRLFGIDFAGLADMMRKACQQAAREGTVTWAHIALEEVFEALAEDDPAKLRAELIQGAAVFVAWAEAIDRRQA